MNGSGKGPRASVRLGLVFLSFGLRVLGGGTFPENPRVVDVTKPPYSARGDGVSDDTEALQRAFQDHVGRNHLLWFPRGVYRVTRTLTWPKRWEGRENWGMTWVRGEDRDQTVLRLADGVFPDRQRPGAILDCGGFGSADWFHNYVESISFDVGGGNAGAVGLRFYSNNSGAVRHCRFRAGENSGLIGLDLGTRDMNGPLLVQDCEIQGFERGVYTAHAVNSQTFERLRLRGQRQAGFENEGQILSLRGLTSENQVPAVRTYGTLCLLDADLTGLGPAKEVPALVNYNGGVVFLRDVRTRGYRRAVGDVASPDVGAALRVEGSDKPGSLGPEVVEYGSLPVTRLFAATGGSLRLPVRETPDVPWDPPSEWAVVDAFGADPDGVRDSSGAIQRAIDSGATTVFLPGSYRLLTPVVIRGVVRRVIGLGGTINYGHGLKPDLRIADGTAPVVVLEHFSNIHGGLEIATGRTVVLRSVADCDLTSTAAAEEAEWFLEDVVTHGLHVKRQTLWARQLNIENEGTHFTNDGGTAWILGYKTERGGTLVRTLRGGRTEILGGFSYTTTAGQLAPMLVNEDSDVFAFLAEICYSGDPFHVRVQESRNGEVRKRLQGEGLTLPYVGRR
ncbi:MAG: hypothetical protein JNL10_00165 [Verrucomicrobiales bacterium]|nr:hypothetical protein [Verrucomicrobiales bacterium]